MQIQIYIYLTYMPIFSNTSISVYNFSIIYFWNTNETNNPQRGNTMWKCWLFKNLIVVAASVCIWSKRHTYICIFVINATLDSNMPRLPRVPPSPPPTTPIGIHFLIANSLSKFNISVTNYSKNSLKNKQEIEATWKMYCLDKFLRLQKWKTKKNQKSIESGNGKLQEN